MDVAVLHQHLEHLAGLVGEQHVVRHHDGAAATGLQQREHVLEEVELFVARLHHEVVTDRRLVRALRPERRIGEDHVEALARRRLVDRVAERDVRLDLVQVQVHQRQAAGTGDEILAVVGLGLDPLGVLALELRRRSAPLASRMRRPEIRPSRRPGRRS